MVHCFLGFGDVYDNVERFNLITLSYEPIAKAKKVATFNLMLDNQTNIWFQNSRWRHHDLFWLCHRILLDKHLPNMRTNGTWSTNSSRWNKRWKKQSEIIPVASRVCIMDATLATKISDDKLMSRFIGIGHYVPTLQNSVITIMCWLVIEAYLIVMTFEYSMTLAWCSMPKGWK